MRFSGDRERLGVDSPAPSRPDRRADRPVDRGGAPNASACRPRPHTSVLRALDQAGLIAALLPPHLPLPSKQILLKDVLSGSPQTAVAGDAVDPEHGERPQRWDVSEVRRFMLLFGLRSSVFDLLTFAALLRLAEADERSFQTAWFVLSLLTEIAAVLALRTPRPMLASRPGRHLLALSLGVAAVAPALPYLGRVSALFGFVPLSPPLMLLLLLIAGAYVAANEATKRLFWRQRE